MKIHRKLGSNFARVLYEERRKRGWGEKKMAEFLGISPSLVHYYEREEKTPRLETVDFIAEKLGKKGIDMLKEVK